MKQKISLGVAKKLAKLPALLVFLLIFGLYGCSTKIGRNAVANYNNNPLVVVIPAGLSPESIEYTMADTLIKRKWSIKSRSPNEVVGTLNHRGYDATVTLQLDGSRITILNDATYRNSNTEVARPAVPMGWLLKLQKNLQSRFRRLLVDN